MNLDVLLEVAELGAQLNGNLRKAQKKITAKLAVVRIAEQYS